MLQKYDYFYVERIWQGKPSMCVLWYLSSEPGEVHVQAIYYFNTPLRTMMVYYSVRPILLLIRLSRDSLVVKKFD